MLPGLHMPPKEGAPQRTSWWGSLRPNVRSLRPEVKAEAPAPAPKPRAPRWPLALGGALVCATIAGAAVYTSHSHSHSRAKSVKNVVSGRAGLRKTTSGAVEHWPSSAVTVTIDPTLAHAAPAAKDAIMSAFGAWASSGALLPPLSFDATSTRGEAVQDGVNRLLLGPITVPGHEEDLAITISYADVASGETLEADTIFNDAYDWTSVGAASGEDHKDTEGKGACKGRYDLQNVATHEAGHFFGLGEDYDDTSTTMYVSSLPCQTSKRTLSTPDVTAVSSLYTQAQAQAQAPAQGQPAGSASSSAACGARIAGGRDTSGGAWLATGVAAFALARRRRRG